MAWPLVPLERCRRGQALACVWLQVICEDCCDSDCQRTEASRTRRQRPLRWFDSQSTTLSLGRLKYMRATGAACCQWYQRSYGRRPRPVECSAESPCRPSVLCAISSRRSAASKQVEREESVCAYNLRRCRESPCSSWRVSLPIRGATVEPEVRHEIASERVLSVLRERHLFHRLREHTVGMMPLVDSMTRSTF